MASEEATWSGSTLFFHGVCEFTWINNLELSDRLPVRYGCSRLNLFSRIRVKTSGLGQEEGFSLSCQHFQMTSSLKPLSQLYPCFIVSLLGLWEQNFVQMVLAHWPRSPPCPYMLKTLWKSSSPEPRKWELWKLDIKDPWLKAYQFKWWSYIDLTHLNGKKYWKVHFFRSSESWLSYFAQTLY